MAEMIFGIVGVVTGISGMLCAIIVASRNKKKDDKTEGKQDGVLMTEIGYIKKGVDGIEQKFEKLENQYIDLAMQVAEIKGEIKRFNKRIETLEKFHTHN